MLEKIPVVPVSFREKIKAGRSTVNVVGWKYRVYKKKLHKFEIALKFAKQLLVSSF